MASSGGSWLPVERVCLGCGNWLKLRVKRIHIVVERGCSRTTLTWCVVANGSVHKTRTTAQDDIKGRLVSPEAGVHLLDCYPALLSLCSASRQWALEGRRVTPLPLLISIISSNKHCSRLGACTVSHPSHLLNRAHTIICHFHPAFLAFQNQQRPS